MDTPIDVYPFITSNRHYLQTNLILADYDALIMAKTPKATLDALEPYFDAIDGLFGEHLGSKEDLGRPALNYLNGGPRQPMLDAAYLIGARVAALGIGAALNLIFAEQERLNLPVGVVFSVDYRQFILKPYYGSNYIIPFIRRPPTNVDLSNLTEISNTRFTDVAYPDGLTYQKQPIPEPFEFFYYSLEVNQIPEGLVVFCYHTFFKEGFKQCNSTANEQATPITKDVSPHFVSS